MKALTYHLFKYKLYLGKEKHNRSKKKEDML